MIAMRPRWLALAALVTAALAAAAFLAKAAEAAAPFPGTEVPAGGYQVFHVYGTEGAGVRAHYEPFVSTPVYTVLPEGTVITVFCQQNGNAVTDHVTGVTSDIWDGVTINDVFQGYVSDLYVDTPAAGQFSPGIPRGCNNTNEGGGGLTPGPQ
jgi:ABC-type thiamine transport system substrate-binding protein